MTVFFTQILVTLKKLQSVLGIINFLAPLINLGHLHMRSRECWLSSRWDHTLPSIDQQLQADFELDKPSKSGWGQISYI